MTPLLSLAAAASEVPERSFLVTHPRTLSFREVAEACATQRRDLERALSPDTTSRVGIVVRNDVSSVVRLLAAWEAGVTVVALHPRWSTDDRAKAEATFDVGWTWDDEGLGARDGRPQLEHDPDCALILTSSGSTGTPKGVMLARRNVEAAVTASATNLGVRDDDCWWCGLPLCHVGGLSIILRSLAQRCPFVLRDGFDAEAFRQDIEAGATLASLTPTMLRRLLERHPTWRPPLSLRGVLLGGGPCPDDLLAAGKASGYPLLRTYGMTETGAQIATQRPGAPASLGVGEPLPGVEVREVDGRLQVQSRQVMLGYFPPLLHDHPIDAEGWLTTGDRGFLAEDGSLVVTGRADEVVNTGGEKVHPRDIEDLLRPLVEGEVHVFGVPDDHWGERVVAAIEGPAPATLGPLSAKLREVLTVYKRPKAVAFIAPFPRNEMGKLDRRRLREEALGRLEEV